MLETYIQKRQQEKGLLLMTHIVMGYPSFEDSLKIVEAMVGAGVDLVELQIPFSEPIADGPVILEANQKALARGVRVEDCLEFATRLAVRYDIPFLIMSYYNILFKYGVERFVHKMAASGLYGSIVPDLPPEEGEAYCNSMQAEGLDPIFLFSPTTPDARMAHIASFGRGFIYCVARKGVTGAKTDFTSHLSAYLERCRRATRLPLALGFGVKERADIDFLRGKADIAVMGTHVIRLIREEGIGAIGPFIRSLQ